MFTEISRVLTGVDQKFFFSFSNKTTTMAYADIKKKNLELWDAAMDGNAEKVEQLVRSGANVDSHSGLGNTPMHLAAYFGHAEVIRMLVRCGSESINAVNNDGRTPLGRAWWRGKEEAMQALLENGANGRL